jgi:hypothetical protein
MASAAAGAGASAAGAAASSLANRFRSLVSTQPRIILGTASASRRFVMDQLRKDYAFEYEVIKADIDEKAIRHDTPRDLVLALAHAKADAIIAQLHQQQQQEAAAAGQPCSDVGLLITCDQVVVHEGQIREKPEDIAEAHRWGEGWDVDKQSGNAHVCIGWGSVWGGLHPATDAVLLRPQRYPCICCVFQCFPPLSLAVDHPKLLV